MANKNEIIDIAPLFPKFSTVLNFKSFNVHSLSFSFQSPASRVKRPESSVQLLRPEFRNSGMPLK